MKLVHGGREEIVQVQISHVNTQGTLAGGEHK